MQQRPERGRAATTAIPARWGRAPALPVPGFDLRSAIAFELDRQRDARRFFLWLPVLFGAGILLFFAADGVPGAGLPLALSAVLGICALVGRAKAGLFLLLTAAATLLAGFGAAALRTADVAAPVLARPAIGKVSGFVERIDHGPAGGRLVLRVTALEARGIDLPPRSIRLTLRSVTDVAAGDHVSVTAWLMPPPQPALPGGYDFAGDAYFKRIGAVGRASGPVRLSPAPTAPELGLRLAAAVDNARNDLTARIIRLIGGQAGALSAAMITGKRGFIDETRNGELRAAGIYHIVSISGLHMVLAAGVFFWMTRAALALVPGLALMRPIKKIAALVAMAGATAYCVFSGSEVATERSLITTLVLLAAILFDRPALSMRNLAISALIVLAREPEALLGPSFQMSFAAVAALIAGHEVLTARKRSVVARPTGWPDRALRLLWLAVVGSLATTLIATFATSPYSAFHFHRLNPYGLIGNALAIPFVSLIVMPAAVIGVLLLPFGLDAPVWWAMGAGSAAVLDVAARVASIEGSSRAITMFPVGTLLLFTAGLLWLTLWTGWSRIAGLVPIVAAFVSAGHGERPVLIVDRQAAAAAFRGADGRLVFLGRRIAPFTAGQWLAADGDSRAPSDRSLYAAQRCDSLGCVGRLPDGRAVALVFAESAFPEDCRRAAIVITALRAPSGCAAGGLLVDRTTLASTGALAVYDRTSGWQIEPARPAYARKPWHGAASPPVPSPVVAPAPTPPATTTEVRPARPDGADLTPPDIGAADLEPH